MLYVWLVYLCGYLYVIPDPPTAELDQTELPILCDGLRRYLQDLPQPIVPTAIYAQMVHTAKGESKRLNLSFCDDLCSPKLALQHKC